MRIKPRALCRKRNAPLLPGEVTCPEPGRACKFRTECVIYLASQEPDTT